MRTYNEVIHAYKQALFLKSKRGELSVDRYFYLRGKLDEWLANNN
jgi:hypothetical protein